MQVIEGKAVPIKAWIDGVELEDEARQQLINLSQMPFIHKHVAVMPDVHHGAGSTIGSVIPTTGAIIPASVGVDIGCGMMAVRTSLTANDLPDSLGHIRSAIESAVPHGRTDDGGDEDRGAWHDVPHKVEMAYKVMFPRLKMIGDKQDNTRLSRAIKRSQHHLGTLGTGNHFVEVCLDEADDVWVMLHSGSRGIGNTIGSHFIEIAKQDMKKWFINLPDKDLAYLPEGTDHFDQYIEAMLWAQDFAMTNRALMMSATLRAIQDKLSIPFEADPNLAINCHHNYATRENHFGQNIWVTRKGAVQAREGSLGIIPGSMGAKSFIVEGLGNRDSFCSCSHGAGRRMSRNKARKLFTVADHVKATAGVECRKDEEVLDETPMAYKDIDAVMAAQADLVTIKHTLKQVLCVKG